MWHWNPPSLRVKHALQLYPLWNNRLLTPLCWPPPPHTQTHTHTLNPHPPPLLSFLSQRLIAEPWPFSSPGRKSTRSHGFNQGPWSCRAPSTSTAQLRRSPSPTRRPRRLLIESWLPVTGDHIQETWHLLSFGSIISPPTHNPPPAATHTHTHTHAHTHTHTHTQLPSAVAMHYLEWACLLWVCAGRAWEDPVAEWVISGHQQLRGSTLILSRENLRSTISLREIYQSNCLHTYPGVVLKNSHNRPLRLGAEMHLVDVQRFVPCFKTSFALTSFFLLPCDTPSFTSCSHFPSMCPVHRSEAIPASSDWFILMGFTALTVHEQCNQSKWTQRKTESKEPFPLVKNPLTSGFC